MTDNPCSKRDSGAHLWRGFYDAIKHRHVERCWACGAIRELPTTTKEN